MTKLKTLSIWFIILTVLFSAGIVPAGQLRDTSSLCQSKILQALLPWDSACFYTAIYKTENKLEDVHYEKYRLDEFTKRGGLSPAILWYRSVFSRTFQNIFELSNSTVEEHHWDYQSTRPSQTQDMVAYLKYLIDAGRNEHAQANLNKYCDKFISISSYGFIGFNSLQNDMIEQNVKLNLSECEALIPEEHR